MKSQVTQPLSWATAASGRGFYPFAHPHAPKHHKMADEEITDPTPEYVIKNIVSEDMPLSAEDRQEWETAMFYEKYQHVDAPFVWDPRNHEISDS